jgi:hypothetical protein
MTTTALFLAATTALALWVVAGTAITRRRNQQPPADSAGLDWIPQRVVRGQLITWTPDDEPALAPLLPLDDPDYRPGDPRWCR